MLSVACLCPTYKRPRLLENAIACFEAQDYPGPKRLFILDDAGQIQPQSGDEWELHATPTRFPSLPAKYNALLAMAAGYDAIAVWEDDDIYLPHHLSVSLAGLHERPWSKPSQVITIVPTPKIEDAAGRFHASLVMRADLLRGLGGWPATRRMDFDLQLIARLHRLSPPFDPSQLAPPSYVFRWASTRSYHGQAYSRGPDDEGWWERIPAVLEVAEPVGQIVPRFDAETHTALSLD